MSSHSSFNLFATWLHKSAKFDELKRGPKRDTSVSFGVKGIISSLFCLLFAVLFALCLKSWSGASDTEAFGLWLFYLLGFIVCILCFLLLFFESLLDVQYQMRLNKRAIGWISLVLFICCVIGGVVIMLTVSH